MSYCSKSMDSTATIVSKIFNDKFSYAQIKYRVVITNIISPFARKQILPELKGARFISVFIISSNHLDEN
jgi:hypothetical protein